MGEKIAMGFHTCVDYELVWDTKTVEEQIRAFDIHAEDIKQCTEVNSERDLWIECLAHLQAGTGGEIVPEKPEICETFADRFKRNITLGGTATRAAIVLDRLGYSTVLQTSCYNEHVERLMPDRVHVISGVSKDHHVIYPHVVLTYHANTRVCANDINIVTPRENRILISRDIDSLNLPVLSDEFGPFITDADVFLLGCLSEILDKSILEDRVEKIKKLWKYLPQDAVKIMEDGCYIKKDFRFYVHEQLASMTDILSMNEDELQEYIGERIDILDPEIVLNAVQTVHKNSGIQTILVHSAKWALAYGKMAPLMTHSLTGGITMSATRFRIGDEFTPQDYKETMSLPDQEESVVFSKKIEKLADQPICCLPCKDLSYVKHPTVVGLGDSFAGGLLPGLLKENRG